MASGGSRRHDAAVLLFIAATVACTLLAAATEAVPSKPHVVLLVLDDAGWADVGYHGGDFPTPNIDRLARGGVRLEGVYVMPQCSPTRSALLTGRYSFRTGMQHFTTIFPGSEAAVPLEVPMLPEIMQINGWSTHMIGKWHVGYASVANTPTGRGFNSFVGYLQGQIE